MYTSLHSVSSRGYCDLINEKSACELSVKGDQPVHTAPSLRDSNIPSTHKDDKRVPWSNSVSKKNHFCLPKNPSSGFGRFLNDPSTKRFYREPKEVPPVTFIEVDKWDKGAIKQNTHGDETNSNRYTLSSCNLQKAKESGAYMVQNGRKSVPVSLFERIVIFAHFQTHVLLGEEHFFSQTRSHGSAGGGKSPCGCESTTERLLFGNFPLQKEPRYSQQMELRDWEGELFWTFQKKAQ